MKKKVGNLFNKPVVQGNLNEINSNEIHIKTERGGGGITLSERKNGNLETISGNSESSISKLKSRKICWKLDLSGFSEEAFLSVKGLVLNLCINYPLYSSIYKEESDRYKYYGPYINMPLVILATSDNGGDKAWYFEEAEDIENHYDGFMGFFKTLDPSVTEEMVYKVSGLKKIPYEEYMAIRADIEKGKDYIQ